MKKLLVLLVSAALVLSMAAVSMADVKVSGEVAGIYNFQDGVDKGEAKIVAENKINDELSAKVAFKGTSADTVKVDEWNFIYKPGFVDIQVGYWGYKSKGLVDVVDYVFGDFKSEAAILVSKNLDNGFNLGLWYTTDESSKAQWVDDNAFVFNVGYTNDYVDLDAFLIDLNLKAGVTYGDTQAADSDLSYSVTAALTMFDGITPYLSYGALKLDGSDEESIVLGVKYALDALEVRAEYDMSDDVEDYYGIKVKYTFESGIFTEYKYTNEDSDTVKNELKFGVKF